MDYITSKALSQALHQCKELTPHSINFIMDKFTMFLHANPAHPENQNVMFKSLNSGYAQIFDGDKFIDKQATDVQDKIIQNVGKMVGTTCDDMAMKEVKEEIVDVFEEIDQTLADRGNDIENGNNTRKLGKCRNMVKATLHTNKEDIEITQNLSNGV